MRRLRLETVLSQSSCGQRCQNLAVRATLVVSMPVFRGAALPVLLLLLPTLLCSCGRKDASSPPDTEFELPEVGDAAIIGGYATWDYPAVGMLNFWVAAEGTTKTCTGTVIAQKVVLTSKHCFTNRSVWESTDGLSDLSSVKFTLHKNERSAGRRIGISRVVLFEPTVPHNNGNDLAIVLLTEEADVAPMLVNEDAREVRIGLPVRLVGFGKTSLTDPTSSSTKRTLVLKSTIVSNTTIGATPYNGSFESSCGGDSGGPWLRTLFHRGTVVGVHRGSLDCAPPLAAVRVDQAQPDVYRFIQDRIREAHPSPSCASVPSKGLCLGPMGIVCSQGRAVRYDCHKELGLICNVANSRVTDPLDSCDWDQNVRCSAREPSRCDGNVLVRCEQGLRARYDCGHFGLVCVAHSQGGWCNAWPMRTPPRNTGCEHVSPIGECSETGGSVRSCNPTRPVLEVTPCKAREACQWDDRSLAFRCLGLDM